MMLDGMFNRLIRSCQFNTQICSICVKLKEQFGHRALLPTLAASKPKKRSRLEYSGQNHVSRSLSRVTLLCRASSQVFVRTLWTIQSDSTDLAALRWPRTTAGGALLVKGIFLEIPRGLRHKQKKIIN